VAEALIGQGVAITKTGLLRRSRQRLIAAHERVRRDIAVQLHDDFQEELLDLKGQREDLLKGVSSASDATRLLGNVLDGLSRKIALQVGALSRQLYPSTLNDGIVPAIQSLRDQFWSALAIETELDEVLVKQQQADGHMLPEQVGLAAYRIAEEALTNVVKHAKASKVTVRLDSSREGWLRLAVRDDGQGFDVQKPHFGLGMGTMQDYAEAVDGECSIHSDPGGGTEVTAVLPLSQAGAEHEAAPAKGGN
jgi:signal transduction histidine kinase